MNNSTSMDSNVHFKKVHVNKVGESKRDILPKITKKEKNKYNLPLSKRLFRSSYLKYPLYAFIGVAIALLLAYSAYLGTMWVINTRASKNQTYNSTKEVLGFSNVPEYPGSVYVFLPEEETDSVREFLSSGRSIYRLDWNSNIEDVFDFYKVELPKKGWEQVKSVERTNNEMMYGDYYVKKDENIGIRIFDRVNDIWYEKLTPEDAKSGLSERVKKDAERELIIASDEGTDLLPDYPFSLKVPREYIAKYFATDQGTIKGVQFVRLASNKEYILEPVLPLDAGYDDLFLEEYVKRVNFRLSQGNEKHKWEIINSKYAEIGGRSFLEANVRSEKGEGLIYILNDPNTKYAFAFFQPHDDTTFSQYLLRNIESKKTSYSRNDLVITE